MRRGCECVTGHCGLQGQWFPWGRTARPFSGSHRILPGRSKALLPGRVTMTIHEPLPTAGLGPGDRDALMARAREAIASGLTSWERGDEEDSSGTP